MDIIEGMDSETLAKVWELQQIAEEFYRREIEEESGFTEEERQKGLQEDEIKNKVALLFIQEFKDDYTEERLEEWKKTGRFSRFMNTNESTRVFAQNGGWHDISKIVYKNSDYDPFNPEGATIPIIDIYKILKHKGTIEIKGTNAKVKLGEDSKNLLSEMIEEYLNNHLDPKPFWRGEGVTYSQEYKDFMEEEYAKRNTRLDYDWREEPDRFKEQLKKWNNDKIKYASVEKRAGYYYLRWYDIIPWTDAHSETDKMIFLYKLGREMGLSDRFANADLTNAYDRKEVADWVKYQIMGHRNWKKKMGK